MLWRNKHFDGQHITLSPSVEGKLGKLKMNVPWNWRSGKPGEMGEMGGRFVGGMIREDYPPGNRVPHIFNRKGKLLTQVGAGWDRGVSSLEGSRLSWLSETKNKTPHSGFGWKKLFRFVNVFSVLEKICSWDCNIWMLMCFLALTKNGLAMAVQHAYLKN